ALRLGERTRAAVVLSERAERERVGGARSGAAPEAAVVAVDVDAELGEAGGEELVAAAAVGLERRGVAAVLTVVLERDQEVDGLLEAAAAARGAERLARLAREVETVGIGNRDEDHAGAAQQPAHRLAPLR